jgi:phytoene dehydrogenase-like protein
MGKKYDVVVAGAGSNSLSAAGYLAKAGLSVCVLEKNDIIGGGVVSRELTQPGFKHEPHATGFILVMANPMIKNDELDLRSQHGLRFFSPEKTISSVFDDESYMSICPSLDLTYKTIAQISQRDAEAYLDFASKVVELAPLLQTALFSPPVSFGQLATALEASPIGQEMLRGMMMSCSQLLDELFENDKVKIHFMKWMGIFLVHADRPGTGMVLYAATAVAHTQEESGVYGGAQAFSDALGACITANGGEIRTNTPVKKVLTSGGIATGVELADGEEVLADKAVIGCIHPHHLGDMVAGLDPSLVEEARRCELSSHTGILTHWALNESPHYICPEVNDSLLVQAVPSQMADMRRILDDVGSGKLPHKLAAIMSQMAQWDPSRAPAGKHTLYFWTFGPRVLENGGWTPEVRDRARDWMMSEFRNYTTNMGPENIIAGVAESPVEQEVWSPSFVAGDFMGIGMFQHQLFGHRPTRRLAQYAVPGADHLYLCGPFMHPGGAVTGGGRATAIKIMQDLGIDASGWMDS